jgi:hypothetical protein
MAWLTPPFYTAPAPIFAPSSTPQDPAVTWVCSVESYLQQMLQSILSYIPNFTNKYWNPWLTAKAEQAWIESFTVTAQDRIARYPMLSGDPVALGQLYGSKLVTTLQQIDAGGYGGTAGMSVWDYWVANGVA